MTQRDKRLAIIVGGLASVVVVVLLVWTVYGAFARRAQQKKSLIVQKNDSDVKINRGKRAGQLLQQYAEHTLPANPDIARSVYQDWLVKISSDVGLKDGKVTALSPQKRGDVYTAHSFRLTGNGNIEQLTNLLYILYGSDLVHRIRAFDVRPIKDKKELQLGLTVEALSMPSAPNERKLSNKPAALVAGHDLEYYKSKILGRNLFSPENQAPTIKGSDTLVAYRGQPFEFAAEADDPDKLDQVNFDADVSKLPGARFSGGRVQWTPAENGDYEMLVTAHDNGFPNREVQRQFKVKVQDPPKVTTKPSFDAAKFAFITGVTESNGRPQVWVTIRTEGRTLRLGIGDTFHVGEMEAKIAEVDGNRVIIDAGGERITTRLGQAIVQ